MELPQSTSLTTPTIPDYDSEDPKIEQLCLHYKRLHPYDSDPEADQSFALFLKDANVHLVNKYLDDLQSFFDSITSRKASKSKDYWVEFVSKDIPLDILSQVLKFKGNNDLEERAIKLGFLRNYPQFYEKPDISITMMLKALEIKSDEEACAMLEAGPKVQYPSQVSGKLINKGYNLPFLRFDKIIRPMLETINQYTEKWKDTEYLAPYAALIGPSMSGKSRLLMEMAQHICVVYICLRPTEFSGSSYPPRSALASHMLPKDLNKEDFLYNNLIASIFQVVTNFFNDQHPADKKVDRLKKWNDYTEVASMEKLDRSEATQQDFTCDVLVEMKRRIQNGGEVLSRVVEAMWKYTAFISNEGSSVRVLLAIDEARALLAPPPSGNEQSYFFAFCPTLQKIPHSLGFFAIVVDTTSYVANFSVVSKFDPSARVGFEGHDVLYAPLYEISLFDAMVPSQPPQSWKDLVSSEHLFKYRNTIFGAYFSEAIAEQQPIEDIETAILELAHFKLLGPSLARCELTKAQAFAFLGPTIQP